MMIMWVAEAVKGRKTNINVNLNQCQVLLEHILLTELLIYSFMSITFADVMNRTFELVIGTVLSET
jgi:hypothetical protein